MGIPKKWRFPFRHRGTPSYHPFIDGTCSLHIKEFVKCPGGMFHIFHEIYKPSRELKGFPHGNPQMIPIGLVFLGCFLSEKITAWDPQNHEEPGFFSA